MNEAGEATDEGDKSNYARIRTEMYDFFCELYTCEYLLSLFDETGNVTRAQRKQECIRICTDNIDRLYKLAADLWDEQAAEEMKSTTRREAFQNTQEVKFWGW